MSASNFVDRAAMSVESVNTAFQPSSMAVRRAARRGLRPVEVALLARYRPALSGDVLELGSRGDGLTEALDHHAETFTGIAFSAPEAELCRSRFARASFAPDALVELDGFDDGQFDAVGAGRYCLDRFGNEQRCEVLQALARIIADDGILIFSSHNLARESLVRPPLRQLGFQPWTILGLPRRLRNRASLGPLQERSYGFAMLNDSGHAYSRLNYYVSRDYQDRQLRENDLALLDCVDQSERYIPPGSAEYAEREFHYVARRNRG